MTVHIHYLINMQLEKLLCFLGWESLEKAIITEPQLCDLVQ